MWGNRFGWTISAAIFLAAMALAYHLYTLGQPTPPTGELVAAVKPFALVDGATALLPPVKPLGDAGDLYRKAIADYQANQQAYDALAGAKDLGPAAVEMPQGLRDVLAATDCPTMDLFRSRPELIVNYDQTIPALDALEAIGKAATNVALLAAFDKQYKTANEYGTAVLALGLNLYRERLTYDELSTGTSLMGSGVAVLKSSAEKVNDTEAAAKLSAFDKARLDEYGSAMEPARQILSTQDDAHIARYAGDFFRLADDKSADAMWRVEALRRLGRLQLNAVTLADNVAAKAYLRRAAADPSLDPVMHQAAVSARDITSYQNQSQR
jgi:hypothetical protein